MPVQYRQGAHVPCPRTPAQNTSLTGRQPIDDVSMNHATAWNLIPWFVNGRASDRDREALEAHLTLCADCRAEIEAQRGLMNAMQTTPVVESMPHASLQKLWQRIDADPAQAMPAPVRMRQT